MDMSVEHIGINSGDKFDDIEHHFRVLAGPGAGKTHWLVNHIKEVLHNSERLEKSRKVACITYTNTAVEIIRNRLGSSANQVEVSTIHSFLYKHIVKPYMHFIADDYGFDISRLDGHDDIRISNGLIIEWVKDHSKKSSFKHPYSLKQLTKNPDSLARLTNWLYSIGYKFDANDSLIITANKASSFAQGSRLRDDCLTLLEVDLYKFKKKYWSRSVLHHDDVLFFSFQLIIRFPFILKIIRAKYPYFFVDEFQDSNPIQVELLRRIGEQETIVGIIGDKAQSIFQFQGANPEQFNDFQLEGLRDYKIDNNRRSTKEIINLLNHIRPNFKQQCQDEFNGNKPVIYVGDRSLILKEIERILLEKEIVTLSWKNITANALKKDMEGIDLDDKLFDELKGFDNVKRYRLVISCVKAVELCRENKIKEALNELKKYFPRNEQSKRYALDLLFLLNSRYSEYCDQPLINFYNILQVDSGIDNLPKISRGKPKDFYDTTNYKSLALCVNIVEDTSNNITIHKSKGAEFESILLILDNEKELNFITTPNLDGSEEHRLRYVAVSRAKKNLFITVPSLDKATAKIVEDLGIIEIIRI